MIVVRDEVVVLDGRRWDGFRFEICRVEFRGMEDVVMGSNKFIGCVFVGNFPKGWIAAIHRSSSGQQVAIRGNGKESLQ